MNQREPIEVFVSYSHDSEAHRQRVLALAQKLRMDGLDCQIDQFLLGGPPEGWPRWMQRRVEEADFVLVVCSDIYKRRFEGKERPGTGRGVDWEGILVLQQLYELRSSNERLIPVLFDGGESDIPLPLRPYTSYRLPESYDELYRRLTHQPRVVAAPLGARKVLPPDDVDARGDAPVSPPRAGGATTGVPASANTNPRIGPVYRVVVLTAGEEACSHPLDNVRIAVGRGPFCDVDVADIAFSRTQFYLQWRPDLGTYCLLSTHALNPIVITDNHGHKTVAASEPVPLAPGWTIRCGKTELRFERV